MSNYAKLASINVNDKLEKKNGLSYLSWAWAWDQLLRADAEADHAYGRPDIFADGTMMVYCTVTAFGKARTAHLPVMDHRNKAIQNPDAFQVNTAMQRCLVKAIALHGLGLYIYAGEDLPADQPESGLGKGPKITPAGGMLESLSVDSQNYCRDVAHRVETLFKREGVVGATDEWESEGVNLMQISEHAKGAAWALIDSKARSAIKAEQLRRREKEAA